MKKSLLILISSLALISCSRKVAVQKSFAEERIETLSKAIDSSLITTEILNKHYYDFGEVLRWNLTAVDSVTTDSIESDGIKVIATVSKEKSGIVKTHITAIAKPKQVINETRTKQTEQKHIATIDSVKKDLVTSAKTKDVESKNYSVIIVLIILAIILAGLYFIVYRNLKNPW